VVIVKPLAEAAEAWIADAGLAVVGRERGSGHDVFSVEPSSASPRGAEGARESTSPGDRLEAYRRGEARFKLAGLSYRASGFWGLPEFDTPSYGSAVAAEVLRKVYAAPGACPRVLVAEPGAGHAAIWIARELEPEGITAASRDELALEAAGANLASLPERQRPAYSAVDALGLDELSESSFDLVVDFPVIVPERDWTAPAWDRAARLLGPGGLYLACCSPTEFARLEKRRPGAPGLRWTLLSRKRKKGFVAAAWRRD